MYYVPETSNFLYIFFLFVLNQKQDRFRRSYVNYFNQVEINSVITNVINDIIILRYEKHIGSTIKKKVNKKKDPRRYIDVGIRSDYFSGTIHIKRRLKQVRAAINVARAWRSRFP